MFNILMLICLFFGYNKPKITHHLLLGLCLLLLWLHPFLYFSLCIICYLDNIFLLIKVASVSSNSRNNSPYAGIIDTLIFMYVSEACTYSLKHKLMLWSKYFTFIETAIIFKNGYLFIYFHVQTW